MVDSPFGKPNITLAHKDLVKPVKEEIKTELKHVVKTELEVECAMILTSYGENESNIPSNSRYWKIKR